MKNRYLSFLFFIGSDIIIALISVVLSFLITGTNPFLFSARDVKDAAFIYLGYPLVILLVQYIFNIYNILWRFTGLLELVKIVVSAIAGTLAMFVIQFAVFRERLWSISFYVLLAFFTMGLVYLHRSVYKTVYERRHQAKKNPKFSYDNRISGNVMIIGAGQAGETVINEMMHKREYVDCKIRCVIDDDPYKKGQIIAGIKIVGGREMIVEAAQKYDISVIVFAIPNCKPLQKSEILSICQQTNCKLKVVPSIVRLDDNFSEIAPSIRKVEIEDLLGRDPIDINLGRKMDYVKGKVVMVTGGGGSIGSELCRQIAAHEPKQLIILDIYENNAYEIQNELLHNYPNLDLVALIGSVRDSKRIDYVFRTYKPEIVYHAAAQARAFDGDKS